MFESPGHVGGQIALSGELRTEQDTDRCCPQETQNIGKNTNTYTNWYLQHKVIGTTLSV